MRQATNQCGAGVSTKIPQLPFHPSGTTWRCLQTIFSENLQCDWAPVPHSSKLFIDTCLTDYPFLTHFRIFLSCFLGSSSKEIGLYPNPRLIVCYWANPNWIKFSIFLFPNRRNSCREAGNSIFVSYLYLLMGMKNPPKHYGCLKEKCS